MSFQNANQLIQTFVSNYGNINRTYNVFDYVRALSNANDKVNLDPNVFLVGDQGGKLRKVRMNYFPIVCDVEGSCDQTVCSTGDPLAPKQLMFDITECTATKVWSLAKDDIRLIDNGEWDFNGTAIQMIRSALPEIRRLLAVKMITKLYAMSGVHPDGNPEKRVSVTNPATGIVNPMGRVQIEREYDDAGFTLPYILGSAEVDNWIKMVQIGGLNAQGQRIDMVDTSNVWYDNGLSDRILNDLANGGHILSIAPETFKYVWYLENAGIFQTDLRNIEDLDMLYRQNAPGFLEGTIIDPVTKIPWDLFIRYDECTRKWNFWFKHEWDFFQMPDVACVGEGVNGWMKWRTCQQVIADCPTGTTPSPAVTPETFSWTPTLADLPTISQSVIAGYGSQSNEPNIIANIAALADYMTANSQITFTVNGSNIEYEGYTAITATFNNADVTATFS